MARHTGYIKWAAIISLIIVCVFWLSYFFECVYLIQHHIYSDYNGSMKFLKWVSDILGGTFIIQNNLFGDEFYLKDFPGVIFIAEALFITLLVIAAFIRRQKGRQYALAICFSILSFIGLHEFLGATLHLFVPG